MGLCKETVIMHRWAKVSICTGKFAFDMSRIWIAMPCNLNILSTHIHVGTNPGVFCSHLSGKPDLAYDVGK